MNVLAMRPKLSAGKVNVSKRENGPPDAKLLLLRSSKVPVSVPVAPLMVEVIWPVPSHFVASVLSKAEAVLPGVAEGKGGSVCGLRISNACSNGWEVYVLALGPA